MSLLSLVQMGDGPSYKFVNLPQGRSSAREDQVDQVFKGSIKSYYIPDLRAQFQRNRDALRSIAGLMPCDPTWWLIPLSKWVIIPAISALTLLIPFITRVITHLLSGMNH